jgi:hypothetical protein
MSQHVGQALIPVTFVLITTFFNSLSLYLNPHTSHSAIANFPEEN